MPPGDPIDAPGLRRFLAEVAAELGSDGEEVTIVIAGGGELALEGIRSATADVDVLFALPDEISRAAVEIAKRHDLAPTWLNSRAAPFRPATLDGSRHRELLHEGRLRVVGVPFDQLFVMKLYASRPSDYDDMVALWSITGFETPAEAVDAFRRAYPHAPDDEYLESFVAQIAEESGLTGA